MASVGRVELLAATALTASVNGGAKTLESYSDKFIPYLRVSANNGATTVNCDLQHSADGTNWVTVASFAAVVNLTSTQALTTVEKLLPKVRAVVTLTGVSATVEVALYYDKVK